MQLLLIHSDYIEYEVKKSTKIAEKIEESLKNGRLEDAITAFMAIEKIDESNPDEIIQNAIHEIKKVTEQVKTNSVMVYPYAHLSSSLASKDTALHILKEIEKELLSSNFEVLRAPFGWYKSFKISCKGHPLSELSRTIHPKTISNAQCIEEIQQKPKEIESEALKAEAKAKSSFNILTPDGELHEIKGFDLSKHKNLKHFINYETSKSSRTVDKIPPHVELMRRLELADYEQGSDSGNMRFYPKGRLMKSLLETYVIDECLKLDAMEVETPIMYDMNHPTLKKYLDRFPARQYSIESDKRSMFLRFAACFGQFLMSKDMTISYKSMPLKMVELTRYSFRKEQRGELVGLRRLRAFTMTDMHTLCTDMNQSISEFIIQYDACINTLNEVGMDLDDYEVAIRFTRDFYNENKDFITNLVKKVNKPVLIEIWEERFFYFVLKFEFNFIDALKKASALSTVQIDVENANRYGIKYIDSDGAAKEPMILHCSLSGAIERGIYALLEKGAMRVEKGKTPIFPIWLSPTQVRILPIAERHVEESKKQADKLNCRVDIDDVEDSIGKKIRKAGREWIPFVVVIGDKEMETGILSVSIRSEDGTQKQEMTIDDLNAIILKEIEGKPYRKLPLPMLLSKRPKFV
ncbi:MAG: threonine--tRNA ligase [Methanosarcinaceae archaeon]|nr:threonine--tRNA ligase [Methanosarcinaceae archaeon]